MSGEDETLIHAARRVIRFIRIDDVNNGGLLSIETIKAGNLLEQAISRDLLQQKRTKSGADA